MQGDPIEEFSKKLACDFAIACDESPPGKDCFAIAFEYGNDNKTRMIHSLIQFFEHAGLPKDVVVKGIRDVSSHMNALSYVYLVSADLAETALDD